MVVTNAFLQLLPTVLAVLPLSYASTSPAPTIALDNGLSILGVVNSTAPNVKQYLGIPYAQPPLGNLRFAPPQPYIATNGTVINGTVLPPSCNQYFTNIPTMVTVEVPQFEIGSAGRSEDCLTISVFAPANADGLPVIIWVYGGGFVTGGTDVPYQMPDQWIERSQEHIVVVFNYRMNIFGFPNAAGLDDQNVAMLDQRLAVEWTQTNINKFGGDSSRMVIWGQSAGSASVDFYNFAWPSDPIVTGLIMDSGTAHLDLLKSTDTIHSNFTFVASNVGCANQTDSAAELACMRALPAEAIEEFLHTYQDAGTTPTFNFLPIADDKVIFGNYTEKALDGEMSDVPALMGFNSNEAVFLLPVTADGPAQSLTDSLSYEYFWCPAVKTTYERLAANRTTHRYFFTGNFTNTSPAKWMGANHGSELPQIFGTAPFFRGNSTAFEYAVSYAMQDAYLAFVTDPVAGLETVDWPVYDGPGGAVRIFAEDGIVVQTGTVVDKEDQCALLGLA